MPAKKVLISMALISVLTGAADARVLINGFEHEGEWRGATTVYAGPEGKIEALRDNQFLYLRLTRPAHPLSGADLYLGQGSTRSHMLCLQRDLRERQDRRPDGLRLRRLGAEPRLDR